MIPFPFNENRFSFFIADHLLVGQLCTNSKSDRSLLSCLKVTQCLTSAAVQLMLSTDRCYDNGTIASTLKMKIWMVQRSRAQLYKVSGYGYGLWCSFKWGPHHATSHLRSRLESQLQNVPGFAEECSDPLVQSGGRWQTLGVAAGLGTGSQVQRDPGLASEGVLRLCTLLSLAPLLPQPEPAGLLRLVIRQEHHKHDFPQHQSQPDHRHLPSIRRAPAGACGKGMLPVPDPYLGGDWGWRRLHWIDVNWLHNQVTWIDFFNKNFKIKL